MLRGVAPGKDPETALRNLAALSKRSADSLRPFVAGNDVVIKRGVDHETALRYRQAIVATGWLCAAEIETVAKAAAPAPQPPAARPAGIAAPAPQPPAARPAGIAAPAPQPLAARPAATVGPPPATVEKERPRPRRRSVIIAIVIVAAIMAVGVGAFMTSKMPVGWSEFLESKMPASWSALLRSAAPVSSDRIVGKWTCRREDASRSSTMDVYAFSGDGKFTATSSKSFTIEFSGSYRISGDKLLLKIEGGSVLSGQGGSRQQQLQAWANSLYGAAERQRDSANARLQATARIIRAVGDELSFRLATPSGGNRILSCTRV